MSSNSTAAPSSSPTFNTTSTPSHSPTLNFTESPTFNTTNSPTISQTTTISPTNSPTTKTPSTSPTPYISPTNQVEIIELPNYKSKDPVDGVFIIFTIVLIITMLIACFQTFRKNKKIIDETNKSIQEEFSMEDNTEETNL